MKPLILHLCAAVKSVRGFKPVNAALPLLSFGPYTYPYDENGCYFDASDAVTTDAWPFGLCSLQQLNTPDTQQPPVQEAGESRKLRAHTSCRTVLNLICNGLGLAQRRAICRDIMQHSGITSIRCL